MGRIEGTIIYGSVNALREVVGGIERLHKEFMSNARERGTCTMGNEDARRIN